MRFRLSLAAATLWVLWILCPFVVGSAYAATEAVCGVGFTNPELAKKYGMASANGVALFTPNHYPRAYGNRVGLIAASMVTATRNFNDKTGYFCNRANVPGVATFPQLSPTFVTVNFFNEGGETAVPGQSNDTFTVQRYKRDVGTGDKFFSCWSDMGCDQFGVRVTGSLPIPPPPTSGTVESTVVDTSVIRRGILNVYHPRIFNSAFPWPLCQHGAVRERCYFTDPGMNAAIQTSLATLPARTAPTGSCPFAINKAGPAIISQSTSGLEVKDLKNAYFDGASVFVSSLATNEANHPILETLMQGPDAAATVEVATLSDKLYDFLETSALLARTSGQSMVFTQRSMYFWLYLFYQGSDRAAAVLTAYAHNGCDLNKIALAPNGECLNSAGAAIKTSTQVLSGLTYYSVKLGRLNNLDGWGPSNVFRDSRSRVATLEGYIRQAKADDPLAWGFQHTRVAIPDPVLSNASALDAVAFTASP